MMNVTKDRPARRGAGRTPVPVGAYDELPCPLLAVIETNEVRANPAAAELLGIERLSFESLSERFEISRLDGPALTGDDLPWMRALREESFSEDEVWYDRHTARRLFLRARGRSSSGAAFLGLDDVADHPFALRLAGLSGSVGAALLGVDDPAGVAHAIVEQVQRAIAADGVFLLAVKGDRLELLAAVGFPPEFLCARESIPLDAPMVMAVAARTGTIQEVERIEDLTDGAFCCTRQLLDLGLSSIVALPLVADGEVLGALGIARRRAGKLHALERLILENAAVACALGLRQARSRVSEHLQAERLRTLREAALTIGDALPLPDLLRRLVTQACELTHARYGALGVLAADGNELSDFVSVGMPEHAERHIGRRPGAKGLLGAVIREGKPVRVADMRRDPRFGGFPANHPLMTSFLGVPLRLGKEVFGHFYLADKNGGAEFTEEDERLLELFGAQSALAIGYARQMQRAEDAHRHLDRSRDELAAVIAHDLRNPINAILLQVEERLLRAKDAESVTVSVASLQRMKRSGERVSEMVSDLLDAARIEARRMSLNRSELSLPDVVRSLLEQIRPTLGARSVEVIVGVAPPAVSADLLRLEQILTNLLENAAKYSAPGTPIRMIVESADGGALITTEDQGVGIPPEETPLLFDRFYQAKRARAQKTGLGLGLYITKGLVEAHGGRIWVESTTNVGSRFRFWLPEADVTTANPEGS